MAHQIHHIGPFEGGDYVHDVLKLLSVYGYDLCGNNSAAMCGLYNLAGLKARRRSLTGHVVPEVWFDGKWNYIDTDMFGYVFLPNDKSLASVDELIARPGLFDRQGEKPEPYFPYDPMETMKKAFTDPEGHKDYHSYSLAHLITLTLRTWESVTCYYRPQGKFYIDPRSLPEELSTVYRTYWLNGPVRQNSLAWTDTVPAAYGNGLFEYEPDLRSQVFRLENPQMKGVKVNNGKELPSLAASNKGFEASVALNVSTPWVITGFQNDLINFEDNTDGARLSGWFWRAGKEDENRILVSIDNGRTWKKVWENSHLGAVPFRVDITPLVEGRYGYQVKFEWVDRTGSGRVGLEGLKIATWVELSPMALPRLEPGKNVFRLSTSPACARINECYWYPGESLPGEKLENLTHKNDSPRLQPVDTQKKGVLTFSPGADGIVDEMRLTIAAHTLLGGKIEDVSAVLYISENEGAAWQELEHFRPDPEHQFNTMRFNHIVRGRSLDGGRTLLKIELKGCGLDKLTVNSLVRVSPRVQSALRVAHVYMENGKRQRMNWHFPPGAKNTSYEVEVQPGRVLNETLRFEAVPPE